MRVHRTCLSLLLVLFSAGVDLPVRAQQPDHLNVLTALDERQKTMVANTDVEGLASLACPDLMINAPTNRILTRDQFLAMIKGGQINDRKRTWQNLRHPPPKAALHKHLCSEVRKLVLASASCKRYF